jgi:hypothetical protein
MRMSKRRALSSRRAFTRHPTLDTRHFPMLPLQGSAFPSDIDELQTAILGGLQEREITPASVTATGTAYPALAELRIDLTGASLTRKIRLPVAKLRGTAATPDVTADRLEVTASPLQIEGVPMEFLLSAEAVEFSQATTESGEKLLALHRSGPGRITVAIGFADLQGAILTAAQEAAAPHGVEIVSSNLELTASGGRTLDFSVEITAKVSILKAVLTLTGHADLDDSLKLHLTDLEVAGSGMAGGLATGFIRPHLEKLERQPIDLAVLSLGEIKLSDLRVTSGKTVRVEAAFAS